MPRPLSTTAGISVHAANGLQGQAVGLRALGRQRSTNRPPPSTLTHWAEQRGQGTHGVTVT